MGYTLKDLEFFGGCWFQVTYMWSISKFLVNVSTRNLAVWRTSNIRCVWFLFLLKFTAIVFSSEMVKPWLVIQGAMLLIAIWSRCSIAGK